MSDESYIGVDPEYRNHAYATDAPLPSEDPAVAEREQVAVEYIAEAAVQPPLPEPPHVAVPADELEEQVEPEVPTEEPEVPAEEPQIEQEAAVEPQGDDEAAPEDQTPEGV